MIAFLMSAFWPEARPFWGLPQERFQEKSLWDCLNGETGQPVCKRNGPKFKHLASD
ncbi:hypothetical protein MNBD_ALPHA11-732 [hydrothermal vent metagenome]|uniref:Uncharacterized protein n=1 Tax=hydrothermal vent metagenome TaxID=652676 RepID=A0A3B0UBU4_9ZZZZ